MPIFMDRHDMAEATKESVAEAHLADLANQDKYGARFLTYWYDDERQTTFCLVDAPDESTVTHAHRDAHGDVPGSIVEVDLGTADAFLGRLVDPPSDPIDEPAFRAIVFTDIAGSTEIHDQHGDDVAMDLLRRHNAIARAAIGANRGREVKNTGDGVMASFPEVADAVRASIDMQRGFAADDGHPPLQVRIGINAGEPIEEGTELFGLAVNLARRFCDGTEPRTIMTAEAIRELVDGEFEFTELGSRQFKGVAADVDVCLVEWTQD